MDLHRLRTREVSCSLYMYDHVDLSSCFECRLFVISSETVVIFRLVREDSYHDYLFTMYRVLLKAVAT